MTIRFIHWQEQSHWLGYLEEYPDYWTQGETLEDLIEHLRDLHEDFTQGRVAGARKLGELILP
ncbi:MAG: type II toxin-antitoxin system HicB family antitoxin [Gemmataceae bacterium]